MISLVLYIAFKTKLLKPLPSFEYAIRVGAFVFFLDGLIGGMALSWLFASNFN